MSGTLYVVATPIGNLQDITLRALETLRAVDLIACEDTRHTGILLKAHGISTPTTSFHSYSSESKASRLLDALREGKSLALVTDAGTPGVSDPGTALIAQALAAGIVVDAHVVLGGSGGCAPGDVWRVIIGGGSRSREAKGAGRRQIDRENAGVVGGRTIVACHIIGYGTDVIITIR